MNKALLIDVGGTNIRYAIATRDEDELSNINKFVFDHNQFENIIGDLISVHKVETLIISIAGPKIHSTYMKMTKKDYVFDAVDIKKKFNLKTCILLNDWEAIAYSYNFISSNIDYIKNGKGFNNTILFLGPGTGLGSALLIDNQFVVPSEVGNTLNSSLKLQKNYNIVSDEHNRLEDFLSGSAISSIYKLKTGLEIGSEEVYKKYIENDVAAAEVINGFIKSLAETLSDLALTLMPGKAILLAGSLVRSIYPNINKEEFNNFFIGAKDGVHKEMIEKIPIGVITKKRTPLYGNLYFYKKLNQ